MFNEKENKKNIDLLINVIVVFNALDENFSLAPVNKNLFVFIVLAVMIIVEYPFSGFLDFLHPIGQYVELLVGSNHEA